MYVRKILLICIEKKKVIIKTLNTYCSRHYFAQGFFLKCMNIFITFYNELHLK